jgi:hypothetical protein
MKTSDFNTQVTSAKLNENMNKMFGVNVKLENYSREQLEDMRNKLRTRVFQQEGSAGINDLLTNETYQKDKAMLDLLNTRIKEMLGENIKNLRDKMLELSEAKKGVKAPKYAKKSKPDFLDMDKDGNKTEPMKKAVKDKKVAEDNAFTAHKRPADAPELKTGQSKKTSSGGTATKTASGTVHKAGAKGYGNKWDGKTQDEPAKASKASKTSAEKKAAKANDIKLPAWKGNVTRHSSNHGADRDDGTGDEVKEGMKHPESCNCKECIGMYERDEGKHNNGKTTGFKAVAKKAAKEYGSKAAGERVAGAVRNKMKKAGQLEESQFKHNVRFVNESIGYLLSEDEEGKAKAITSAGDMVNDFTSWMQRVGQYQTKTMIELADAIKADFGAAEAEAFKQAVGPALSATLETLTQQREAVSGAVAALAGEAVPEQPMGMEPGMGDEIPPAMDMAAPDEMNPSDDEFGASDAAAGMGTTGREMRESQFARKLAESHSIMNSLSK